MFIVIGSFIFLYLLTKSKLISPMKLFKKAICAVCLAVVFSSTYQCSSPKNIAVSTPLNNTIAEFDQKIVFQEWYAGIKVGGTGINLFIPVVETNSNLQLDSVYFRNMKGKLIKGHSTYSVVLKNDSPYYQPNPSNEVTNPFDLSPEECLITYIENGKTKYMKASKINEKAGTYYDAGHPSLYETASSRTLATIDED